MSAPLPEALRARFRKLIEEGLSGPAAALRLKLSPATGARWGLVIRRTGQARAAPQGRPRGKGRLDPHRSFLIELIDQDGDMTIPELAGALALDRTLGLSRVPWMVKPLLPMSTKCWGPNYSPEQWSSWRTSPRTRMPPRPKPYATLDAGSWSCRPAALQPRPEPD